MSRMISLEAWAMLEFGEESPSITVLQKYARNNLIAPPAMKVGRKWMVDREARYVGYLSLPKIPTKSTERLQRIISDGCQTANP
ncbi:excisionase [Proteus mirabilis]|uniref:excisionase n=1 Tax=Proteus mirabilis TaxID=584 RepID=UPI0034D697DB